MVSLSFLSFCGIVLFSDLLGFFSFVYFLCMSFLLVWLTLSSFFCSFVFGESLFCPLPFDSFLLPLLLIFAISPIWALDPAYRRALTLKEVAAVNASLVCFQECDHFDDFWRDLRLLLSVLAAAAGID